MPSAWTQHLSAYRASHPSKSMKECMIEASACYRKSGVVAASNAVKMATKKTSSSKKATYRGAAAISSSSNPWIAHVKAYRASHGCSYAEAMQSAKKTYRAFGVNPDAHLVSIGNEYTFAAGMLSGTYKVLRKDLKHIDSNQDMYLIRDTSNGDNYLVPGSHLFQGMLRGREPQSPPIIKLETSLSLEDEINIYAYVSRYHANVGGFVRQGT